MIEIPGSGEGGSNDRMITEVTWTFDNQQTLNKALGRVIDAGKNFDSAMQALDTRIVELQKTGESPQIVGIFTAMRDKMAELKKQTDAMQNEGIAVRNAGKLADPYLPPTPQRKKSKGRRGREELG